MSVRFCISLMNSVKHGQHSRDSTISIKRFKIPFSISDNLFRHFFTKINLVLS